MRLFCNKCDRKVIDDCCICEPDGTPTFYTSQIPAIVGNAVEAKCLRKANDWHRFSLAMDSVDLYDRYVAFNQWTSELSEDDLATFYLLVAHLEFDK